MSDLIAALVEAVVGLVTAWFKALPALVEGLGYVLGASLTVIAYLISPRFREQKRQQWAEKPQKKYFELGISSFCLLSVISLVVWVAWPTREPVVANTLQIEPGTAEHDVRVRIKAAGLKGAANDVTIAVRKDGMRKIMETHSLQELENAVRENLTVTSPAGVPDSGANTNAPIRAQTNRTLSTNGPRP